MGQKEFSPKIREIRLQSRIFRAEQARRDKQVEAAKSLRAAAFFAVWADYPNEIGARFATRRHTPLGKTNIHIAPGDTTSIVIVKDEISGNISTRSRTTLQIEADGSLEATERVTSKKYTGIEPMHTPLGRSYQSIDWRRVDRELEFDRKPRVIFPTLEFIDSVRGSLVRSNPEINKGR